VKSSKDAMPKREPREKEWGYIVFHFKTPKLGYAMVRWLQFGKEMGAIPDSIELQYDGKTLKIGHYTK
jgi:hypothetical protein